MADATLPLRALELLNKHWEEAIPGDWHNTFDPLAVAEDGSVTLSAGRYIYFCPSCADHSDAVGEYQICCGLKIEPYWLTRSFSVRPPWPASREEAFALFEALRDAARVGGQCSGGKIQEHAPRAPRRTV